MLKLSIQIEIPNLDRIEVEVLCPRCKLSTYVLLGEIRRRDYVICRGCYSTINLIDHMGSFDRAKKRITKMLKELEV
ncbi:MAG: hypothetical protein CMK73_05325 [Pseudomonadales bacterium]|nr:hypothetical protein [Pseudomonadales bacterium]